MCIAIRTTYCHSSFPHIVKQWWKSHLKYALSLSSIYDINFDFLFHRTPKDPNIHQCLVCQKFHPLRYCKRFLAMTVYHRQRAVRRHSYCFNCLARSHKTIHCTSRDMCQRCGDAHHTLLHVPIHQRLHRGTTMSRSYPNRQQHQQKGNHQGHIANPKQLKCASSSTSVLEQNPKKCLRIALRALKQLEKTL